MVKKPAKLPSMQRVNNNCKLFLAKYGYHENFSANIYANANINFPKGPIISRRNPRLIICLPLYFGTQMSHSVIVPEGSTRIARYNAHLLDRLRITNQLNWHDKFTEEHDKTFNMAMQESTIARLQRMRK